jgi:mRNA-degrading endonuclease toxin of MazEF toxin-antitoxin module
MTPEEKNALQKSQRTNHWASQKLYYHIGKNYQRGWTVKRGEVYFVDLGENIGSEENNLRPVVILQANSYNFSSPVFTCAIISNSTITIPDIQIPIVNKYQYVDKKGITKTLSGAIDLGQIKTIAKERIISHKIGPLKTEMNEIDIKLLNVFGLKLMLDARDNTIKSLIGKVEYLKKK